MIKLGVFSDEVSQNLATAIALAKEFNLNGLEIRSVWDKPPQELDDDDAAKIRGALDQAGLECYSIASPLPFGTSTRRAVVPYSIQTGSEAMSGWRALPRLLIGISQAWAQNISSNKAVSHDGNQWLIAKDPQNVGEEQ